MTTSLFWFIAEAFDLGTDGMFCRDDGSQFPGWCWSFFSLSCLVALGVGWLKYKLFLGLLGEDDIPVEKRQKQLEISVGFSMFLVVFEDIPQIVMALIIVHQKMKEGVEFVDIELTTLLNLAASVLLPMYTVIKYMSLTCDSIGKELEKDEDPDKGKTDTENVKI